MYFVTASMSCHHIRLRPKLELFDAMSTHTQTSTQQARSLRDQCSLGQTDYTAGECSNSATSMSLQACCSVIHAQVPTIQLVWASEKTSRLVTCIAIVIVPCTVSYSTLSSFYSSDQCMYSNDQCLKCIEIKLQFESVTLNGLANESEVYGPRSCCG